jgi:flagellar biosynthesis protein FlhA
VVDPATVVATHLNQIIQTGAAEMFGMDEAQKLLDALKESAPQLVAGLTPQPLPLASIAALCRSLLAEACRSRTSAASPKRWWMPPARRAIRSSCRSGRQRHRRPHRQTIAPARMPLPVLTLDASSRALLNQAVRAGKDANHPIEPNLAQRIVQAVGDAAGPSLAEARKIASSPSPVARRALSRLLAPHIPGRAGALVPGDT